MNISRRSRPVSLATLAASRAGSAAAQGKPAPIGKIKLVILDIGGTVIQDHGQVPAALMRALSHRDVPATAAEIAAVQEAAVNSEDYRAARQAFLEKRQPVFTGR